MDRSSPLEPSRDGNLLVFAALLLAVIAFGSLVITLGRAGASPVAWTETVAR